MFLIVTIPIAYIMMSKDIINFFWGIYLKTDLMFFHWLAKYCVDNPFGGMALVTFPLLFPICLAVGASGNYPRSGFID